MSLPLIIDWDDTLVYWHDGPEGEWVPGALDFLTYCRRQKWRIIVASARANFPAGKRQIEEKLKAAGRSDIEVAPKPLGFAYVDNRGVEFRGDWVSVRDKVRAFSKA